MASRAGAIGNLPWVRGTSQPGVRMAPRGAQHKETITAELNATFNKLGGTAFIKTYGRNAFNALVAGGAVYEASKFGTLPGDQPEVEEELKELSQPVGFPIKTWEKSYVDTGTEIPEPKKIEPEGLPIPTQEREMPEGFPIPKQKTWRDYILTQDKPKDITKQTEELVPDITTDISKEKVEKYFKDLDILYDKEWYGSVKNIQYAIDHGLEISEDDSHLYMKNMDKKIQFMNILKMNGVVV